MNSPRGLVLGGNPSILSKAKEAGLSVVSMQRQKAERFVPAEIPSCDQMLILDYQKIELTTKLGQPMHEWRTFSHVVTFSENARLVAAHLNDTHGLTVDGYRLARTFHDKLSLREQLNSAGIGHVAAEPVLDAASIGRFLTAHGAAVIQTHDGWAALVSRRRSRASHWRRAHLRGTRRCTDEGQWPQDRAGRDRRCGHASLRSARDARVVQAGDELASCVLGNLATETEALRKGLSARLPDYMIPSTIRQFDRFPTTQGGKVDEAALRRQLKTVEEAEGAETSFGLPSLVAICADILGRPDLEGDSDFFDAGGTSLAAARVAAAVFKRFRTVVPLDSAFERPVMSDLAAHIAVFPRG